MSAEAKSKVVYKYQLNHHAPVEISKVSKNDKVVLAGLQDGQPHIWIEHELYNTEPKERRVYHIVGTGVPVGPAHTHVGSFLNPPFVWHVYEERRGLHDEN